MTYTVCHPLVSKDRCEHCCLSLTDWWLVSLPSVSTPSESLVLSTVVIVRKWMSNMQAGGLTAHETQADRRLFPLASLTLPPLSFICQVYILPWFLFPWGQILAWAPWVRQVWLVWLWFSLQFVSKVFHGGLNKAGFLLSSIIHEFKGTKRVFKVCEGKIASLEIS